MENLPAMPPSIFGKTLALALFLLAPLAAAEGFVNPVGMRLIEIPAGSFIMGTEDLDAAAMEMPRADPGQIRDETPAHKVVFARPFWMSATEVTQAQWLKVMGNRPGPESLWRRKDWRKLPVVSVSWPMAQRFVDALNKLDRDFRYRLPTEAEWEYAARAGTRGLRPWPETDLEDHAWFINNSGDRPHPVATRKPNAWGLYDMIGNAWEWTADWYAPDTYSQETRIDPKGPPTGDKRVRRGGSYHCPMHLTRVAYRAPDFPDKRYSVLGFRLVAHRRQ